MPQNSTQTTYRKNRVLIIVFITLISVSLVIGLFFGYKYTQNTVLTHFSTDKIEILDEAIKPYNDFIFNKIPQISLYQGFLDEQSFRGFRDSYLKIFPFIQSIIFYDVQISNKPVDDGFTYGDKTRRFSLEMKGVYKLSRELAADSLIIFNKKDKDRVTNNFAKIVIRFVDFIAKDDTTQKLSSDQIYKIFYTISQNEVSYVNVPRMAELKIYRQLMSQKNTTQLPSYDQDVVSFSLDATKLQIRNLYPDLYEKIVIKPLAFDSLSTDNEYLTTGIAFPGAISEYQLYFISSKQLVNKKVLDLFTPIALAILAVYALLMLIGILIYRNLNTNSKLFKLQYDFINNLTHEFKTPVSVIKIAGNNIKNSPDLSDNERQMYGKILDEEADKLNDLMNRLLSLTQIENKSIRLRYEEINLQKFCRDMVEAYRIKYSDYKISYEIENIEHFESDKVIMTSIFQNLMDNAYKYSYPNRRELMIKIRKMKKSVFFIFIDKGIGIPKEEQENIFKKFYRIESEFNQQGSVGIGLAFCKEIINFMSGDIRVRSKPGEGSEFRITLPIE